MLIKYFSNHSKFGFLSYEISHIIRQRFNKEAENIGLTHAQWRTLIHLLDNENCRQIDLAQCLEIQPITLARQIDLLEVAGLVRRNKDSVDRRAYRLELMPKARTVIQELWEIADEVEAKVLKILTAQEQEHLTDLLLRIRMNIETDSIPDDSTLKDNSLTSSKPHSGYG